MERITSIFRKSDCTSEVTVVTRGGGNYLFFSKLRVNINRIDRLLPVKGSADFFLCTVNDRRYA